MSPKCRSIVWKYFVKLDRDHVECKLCNKSFKYHTNTSNMKGHLKSRHRDIDMEEDTEIIPHTATVSGKRSSQITVVYLKLSCKAPI